MVTTILAPLEG